MKIQFWTIGKAHEAHVKEGIELFTKRIRHYYSVEWEILPVPKHSGMLSESDLKQKEGYRSKRMHKSELKLFHAQDLNLLP